MKNTDTVTLSIPSSEFRLLPPDVRARLKRYRGGIDWLSVDWSKTTADIARELGADYATVYRQRFLLGKPRNTKLSNLPWHTVDWSQTNGTIAAQLGTNATNVRIWRQKLGKPVSTVSRQAEHRRIVPLDVIQSADWANETDCMIGRRWNVSRERVRQIRQEGHYPECRWKAMTEPAVRFCAWVAKNLESLKTQDFSAVIDAYPAKSEISRCTCRKLLPQFGFTVLRNRRMSESMKTYPYDAFNWGLPNKVLGMIWGTAAENLANLRVRDGRPAPKWDIRGWNNAWLHDKEFGKAVADEAYSAVGLGYKGGLQKVTRWLEKRRESAAQGCNVTERAA